METRKKVRKKIYSIRTFAAEHPRLLMFSISMALTIVLSMVIGFADHQAYAKIEDQQTLIGPQH
ncbi:MAG: hypothetical protein WBE61_01450 [Nitrososphaeraceae archaeon]